ncbi:MAG: radical SAM family heme chaperone HemW [Campylobacterota bacterium]|nr:radical SAM family heme chaperone HemW [Campylobacterota bacterium]
MHIPFCDSKCFYCAFNSYTSLHSLRDDYIKALKQQLSYELKKNNKQIETIFIGGGTPSTIEASKYKEILELIKPYFVQKNIEITIEANPNSASNEWLQEIKSIGINRVSFGVQSFDDKKLDFLGRNHNKTQAIQAINDAFDIGFEDINCDIIYDTQLDTKELLDTDISIIKTLPINHISAYSLTIEEGTKFFNKSSVQVENEELVKYLFEELNSLGFSQYEISNFSKDKDARSKHNLGYWKYKEYLGVGSGAVGCINNTRYYNEKDVLKYIQNPLSYENTEKLSSDDITTEKILLGFRSVVGVDISILPINMQNRAKILIENDKLKLEENIVYSSDFMLADELALYITDI